MKRYQIEKKLLGKVPASFTVEASVIIPLILFIIIFGIRIASEQYGEVKEQAQRPAVINEIHPVNIMWNIEKLKDGLEQIQKE